MPTPSLLQDVLRQRLEAVEDGQLCADDGPNASIVVSDDGLDVRQVLTPPESDEDDPIDVTSGLATPVPRSKDITRSSSPTRSSNQNHRVHKTSPLARKSLVPDDVSSISSRLSQAEWTATTAKNGERVGRGRERDDASLSHDPLRRLPDKVRLNIFCLLGSSDLASCSLVSRRWQKSQTINHAFYQIYRAETYLGSDLPVGKWTRRESKRDWRSELMKSRRIRAKESNNQTSTPGLSRPRTPATPFHVHNLNLPVHVDYDGTGSGTRSGNMTPREIQEEEWVREAESSPSKHEMRSYYKEYGGKRIRKSKTGMTGGMRDRTAWAED